MPKNKKQTTSQKQKSLTTTKLKVSEGFITDDGYAAVPYGKKLMIIFDGQQLEVVNTILQAQKFIKQHRATPQSGTVFV
jgi:hypothetical protein